METETFLKAGLDRLQIAYQSFHLAQLKAYAAETEKWNRKFNLVKASGDELIVKHLFDSLSGLPAFMMLHDRDVILDIGSGAGFPGIILAVFLPDSRIILCERIGKKAIFLKNITLLLGLKNAFVYEGDFMTLKEKADIITFRAFSPIPDVLTGLLSHLKPNGCIIAYKGKKAKIDEELARIATADIHSEVIKTEVPFLDEERHLVMLTRY